MGSGIAEGVEEVSSVLVLGRLLEVPQDDNQRKSGDGEMTTFFLILD